MGLFQSFDISASGMTAQQLRADIIAENIANINTTRDDNGEVYTRKVVSFATKHITPFSDVFETHLNKFRGDGVKVARVKNDTESDYIMEYDPSHPDADENGYVTYPNVNIVTEMTNLIDAQRAYEANTTAFDTSKAIANAGLQIGG